MDPENQKCSDLDNAKLRYFLSRDQLPSIQNNDTLGKCAEEQSNKKT